MLQYCLALPNDLCIKFWKKIRREWQFKRQTPVYPSGPRVTDYQTACDIVVAFRHRPFKTVQSAATEIGISPCTVAKRLASNRCESVPIGRKAKAHIAAQAQPTSLGSGVHLYVRWIQRQLENALFSDVASFDVNFRDHKLRWYMKKNKQLEPEMIIEKTNRG